MKVPGVNSLREALAALGLGTRNHKTELKKRLRSGNAALIAQQPGREALLRRPEGQDFDSYLVLDFEATCQRHEPHHGHVFGFPNEVRSFRKLSSVFDF